MDPSVWELSMEVHTPLLDTKVGPLLLVVLATDEFNFFRRDIRMANKDPSLSC